MSDVLYQVKAYCVSVQKPLEELTVRRKSNEEQKEQTTLVSPEIEVSILRNCTIDLETLLKHKSREVDRLNTEVEEMNKRMAVSLNEKDQSLLEIKASIEKLQFETAEVTTDFVSSESVSKNSQEVTLYEEENKRLREELHREKELHQKVQRDIQSKADRSSEENIHLKAELEAVSTQHSQSEISQNSLLIRVSELMQSIEQTKEELKLVSQQKESITEQLNATQQEKATLQSELMISQSSIRQCDSVKGDDDPLSDTVREENDCIVAVKKENALLQEKLRLLQSNLIEEQQIKEELQRIQQIKDNHIHKIENRLQTQNEQLIHFQSLTHSEQQLIQSNQIKIKSLSNELDQSKQQLHELDQTLIGYYNEKNQFLEDIQIIKQQNQSIRHQLCDRDLQIISLQEQLSICSNTLHSLKQEKEHSLIQSQIMNTHVKILEERIQSLSTISVTTHSTHEISNLTQQVRHSDDQAKQTEITIQSLEMALQDKDNMIISYRSEIASLRVKECDASRLLAQQSRLEKEISLLHDRIQKQQSKSIEEIQKQEAKVTFSEKSLEAYKQEIESYLHDKIKIDTDYKQTKEQLSILQSRFDTLSHELQLANQSIKTYETDIIRLQTLEVSKDEALLLRIQEVNELHAAIAKSITEKESISQTLQEEMIRMQSQLETLSEENGRLRIAFEQHNATAETNQSLLREGEAKLDQWRSGLETSYRQKKVLKQAMRQVLKESSTQRELYSQEQRSRRALERAMMIRADIDSQLLISNHDTYDGEKEFGTFEWARKLSRYIARHPTKWSEYNEDVPAMPEEVAIPVIQNTIESLEWKSLDKNYLMNWLDFFAHGGLVENENRFMKAIQVNGITYDILDGFFTLMIPYLKSGIRSEYSVQTFVKQKPSVICDLEIRVCPTTKKVTGDEVDDEKSKMKLHG